jgi:hypothetical protein
MPFIDRFYIGIHWNVTMGPIGGKYNHLPPNDV